MSDDQLTTADAVRPLAVVTGASTGIGYELAKLLARDGFDLVVAADRPLAEAKPAFERTAPRSKRCRPIFPRKTASSRSTILSRAARSMSWRPTRAMAWAEGFWIRPSTTFCMSSTNITGTTRLLHLIGRDMRARGRGQILLTGSIAGLMPGSFAAVYNASKAYVDSFSFALRNELKDSGVSVTVLMPGPTDTEFFHRAGQDDTAVGQSKSKMDPARVAEIGYQAMKRGDGDVVAGLGNKVQAAMAAVTPQSVLAEMHRKQAEPKGSIR